MIENTPQAIYCPIAQMTCYSAYLTCARRTLDDCRFVV